MFLKPLHLIYALFAFLILAFVSQWHQDKLHTTGILGLWEHEPIIMDESSPSSESDITYIEFSSGKRSNDLDGNFLLIRDGEKYSGNFRMGQNLDQINFFIENREFSIPFEITNRNSELLLDITWPDTIFPRKLKKLN